MALTNISTSNNLRKKVWEEKLYRDTVKTSFFMSRFAGSDLEPVNGGEKAPNNVVDVKTNLEAKGEKGTRKGDQITFGIVPRVDPQTNPGVTTGQKLKGKEVALSTYDFTVTLQRYRQAFSAGTPMDWQRASFSIPSETRSHLEDWGSEKLDILCFDALGLLSTSSITPSVIFYKSSSGLAQTATAATAKAALTASDSKLTPELVAALYTFARTGGNRAFNPLRGLKVDGREYLVLLVHEDALFDWATNPIVEEAHREAMERGKDNPLFTGASYVWHNVIIYGHENCSIGTDGGGASVAWGKGVLLGAQALTWAWGERPSIVEDDDDYGEELYYAWRITAAVAKPIFNSKDYGSVGVYYARTKISDL